MKVLIDHPWPFFLAHGGLQIQIEQTKVGLEQAGVEVEFVRWWDDRQRGDVILYFGRPAGGYIDFAHAKGIKIVAEELLSGLGSRSLPARTAQKLLMNVSQAVLPKMFTSRLAWDSYRKADGFVANTPWEAHLMETMFGADPAKIRVIANGVEDVFFPPADHARAKGTELVCTATIHPRKRVVELTEAAILANLPVWIIGKPYAESDPYYRRFLEVQQSRPELIRYQGAISDRAELASIYQRARGFVLLSTQETHSLSAFEAAAATCPLLLSDLPWARSVFGSGAAYASATATGEDLARLLREFHEKAPSLQVGIQPPRWVDIGHQFKSFFAELLR